MTKRIDDLQKLIKELPGENIDAKTVEWVNRIFEKAKIARTGEDERRRKVMRYYEGGKKHWEEQRLPGYRAKITDNRCFSVVESVLPIVTDSRPKAELSASSPEDIATVKTLKRVYDSKWDELNLEMLTTLVVKDALIFGEGYLKVWFDPTKNEPLGDISITHVNPNYIYKDPDSKHPLLDDAKYIIYRAKTPLELIKMHYPHKATALDMQSVGALEMSSGKSSGAAMTQPREHGTIAYDYGDSEPSDTTTYRSVTDEDKYIGHDQPFLTEVWIDDMTLEEATQDYLVFIDDGSDVPFSQEAMVEAETQGREFEIISGAEIGKREYRRKYPFGRIITICEKVLLRDIPSPYSHGRMPYVRFFDYQMPHQNWAQGEIDQIIPLQDELNKRKSQIIDFFNICINPPIVLDRSAGLNTQKMTNRPGQIWPVSGSADKIKWLMPPPIPAAAFAHIDQINKDIDSVSGVHDVTQGRKPAGITAGIAIDSLQEAAQTRIRLKSRYIDYSQKALAERMISIIWQYYQEPRNVRWRSELSGLDYEYDTVDFGKVELNEMPTVTIRPGSSMATNKSVLRMQSVQLFQMGGIDRRALLDIFEFPNREEIIARMGEGGVQDMGGQPGGGVPSPQ